MSGVEERVRSVLEAHGRLLVDAQKVGDDENLFEVGLSSHASVNVMLALEDEFDTEFPDELLRRSTFESIGAICAALASLGVTDESS